LLLPATGNSWAGIRCSEKPRVVLNCRAEAVARRAGG